MQQSLYCAILQFTNVIERHSMSQFTYFFCHLSLELVCSVNLASKLPPVCAW